MDALDCSRLGKKLTGTWLGYASDENEDSTDDSLDGNTHGNSKLTAVCLWRAITLTLAMATRLGEEVDRSSQDMENAWISVIFWIF